MHCQGEEEYSPKTLRARGKNGGTLVPPEGGKIFRCSGDLTEGHADLRAALCARCWLLAALFSVRYDPSVRPADRDAALSALDSALADHARTLWHHVLCGLA